MICMIIVIIIAIIVIIILSAIGKTPNLSTDTIKWLIPEGKEETDWVIIFFLWLWLKWFCFILFYLCFFYWLVDFWFSTFNFVKEEILLGKIDQIKTFAFSTFYSNQVILNYGFKFFLQNVSIRLIKESYADWWQFIERKPCYRKLRDFKPTPRLYRQQICLIRSLQLQIRGQGLGLRMESNTNGSFGSLQNLRSELEIRKDRFFLVVPKLRSKVKA